MSNKTVSGYTNLLQRLALALSEGRAEAEVLYVPVSNDPYLRVTLGDTYGPIAGLRERLCLALAGRGFAPAGPHVMERHSEAGWVLLHVEAPVYDPVRRVACLDLSASGPYRVEQRLDRAPRDPEAERASFEAARRRAEHEAEIRIQAMRSLVGTLLRAAPFEIPPETRSRLAHDAPAEVVRGIARAFGTQGLASFEDLVERAGLAGYLGLEPPVPCP